MKFFERLSTILETVEKRHLYPLICELAAVEGSGETAVIEGRRYANFASNSYLGLTRHPKVIEAATRAIREFGLGSGGSRLTSGTNRLHRQLEEVIAEFKGTEDSVVFSAGYLANIGVLLAVLNSPLARTTSELNHDQETFGETDVYYDELVHASIIDGLMLASVRLFGGRVHLHRYMHLDMGQLEQELVAGKSDHPALVVTDGIFSLHGRKAPLDQIVRIAHRHGAAVYVDDAHGTGVLGRTGRGTAEMCGVDGAIDIPVGTLSKALGGEGGFCAGTKEFCDYLRIACRTHMFQTSMSPAMAAGLIAAFQVVKDEPERRERLTAVSHQVSSELNHLGFDTFGSTTQIIPVCFETEARARAAFRLLMDEGIFAPPYYYPAVRHDEAMIRVNLMATHTDEQIERLVSILAKAGQEAAVAA